jgi:hypothetical protein
MMDDIPITLLMQALSPEGWSYILQHRRKKEGKNSTSFTYMYIFRGK